jgi:hypothetical protein
VTPIDPSWPVVNFIADFGDLAAIGPAVLGACAVLWARGGRRPALIWVASFLACTTTVFLAKAAVGQSGFDLSGFGIEGPAPSGHTATSIAFYGTLAVLLWRTLGGRRGSAAAAAAAALAVAVITAIEILGWHPWRDVVLGAALGGASAAWAGNALARITAVDGLGVAAVALLVLLLPHGTRLKTEDGVLTIDHEIWPDAARAEAQF